MVGGVDMEAAVVVVVVGQLDQAMEEVVVPLSL